MASLAGQILIASTRLGDPNFARTVVLILAHDENGALGVVLNRPMQIPLSRLSREILGKDTPREGLLFHGGPCESSVLAVYVPSVAAPVPEPAPAENVLPDNLRFGGDRELIRGLLESTEGEVKLFAGYSGWSAGQLESELAEEAWLPLPVRAEHVFAPADKTYLLARTEIAVGGRVPLALIPKDPSAN